MKKIFLLCLTLLLMLSLCSCTKAPKEPEITNYSILIDNVVYIVHKDTNKITAGTNTYEYVFHKYDNGCNIVVTYPDGAKYRTEVNGTSSHSDGNDTYFQTEHTPDGETLIKVVEMTLGKSTSEIAESTNSPNSTRIVFSIIFFILGLFNAISPESIWLLSNGWKYKNVEPSDTYINSTRVVGIIVCIVAVIVFITSF